MCHMLFLETVAVDDRIVQGKGQLQNRCHRVRNKGNLPQQEVAAHVQDRRHDEGQADNRHIGIGIGRKGQDPHHNHRNKGRDHVDFFLDGLGHGVDHRGGNKGVIVREHFLNRIQRIHAALVRLFIIKGDREQRRSLVIVFGGIVEVHHLDAFHLLDLFKKRFRFVIGDIPHHEARRPVSDELPLHHIQSDFGRGVRRQVGGQIILDTDPVYGHRRENNPDNHNQENQTALVDNEGCKLQHKAVLFFRFLLHNPPIPRYSISALSRVIITLSRLRRYRIMLPPAAVKYKCIF